MFVVIEFMTGEFVAVVVELGVVVRGEDLVLEDEHVEMMDQDHQFPVPFLVFLRQVSLPTRIVVDLLLHEVYQLHDTLLYLPQELFLVKRQKFSLQNQTEFIPNTILLTIRTQLHLLFLRQTGLLLRIFIGIQFRIK